MTYKIIKFNLKQSYIPPVVQFDLYDMYNAYCIYMFA